MLRLRNTVHVLQCAVTSRSMSVTERCEREQNHQFDIGDINPYNSDFINLIAGAPGPHLLKPCCDILKIATNHRMKFEFENNAYLLQYSPPVGTKEFRTNLSKFLMKHYKSFVHPSDLVATSGASVGLHVILTSLVDMSGIIFVDGVVTYMIALDSMRQYTNMTIVPVPLTKNGTDITQLEKLIVKHKFESKTKLFWGTYYTIPNFHNPTGISFSSETCANLVKLARKHNLLLTCDDVYNLLYYNNVEPPRRLYSYDDISDVEYKGNVISNCTFSKILAPGLRIGWMEMPPRCVEIVRKDGFLKSGGCLNNYTTGIIASLIELDLMDKILSMHLENYKQNMKAVCDVLAENLPKSCTFIKPGGGYFIWIQLPCDINGNDFVKFSKENYKVVTIVGDAFSIRKEFNNFLRISIAFYQLDALTNGVRILCTALNEFLTLPRTIKPSK